MANKVDRIPENIDFPKEEEKVLKFWKDIDAFHSCLKQSKNKPRYMTIFTFYRLSKYNRHTPTLNDHIGNTGII